MPTCTVSNSILDPSGQPIFQVQVDISTVPTGCFRNDTHTEVANLVTVYTDINGQWNIPLEQSANLNPAGAYYKAVEHIPNYAGGTKVWYFSAPSQGSALMKDYQVSPTGTGGTGTGSDCLTKAQADQLYAPISAVNSIAPSSAPLRWQAWSEIIA